MNQPMPSPINSAKTPTPTPTPAPTFVAILLLEIVGSTVSLGDEDDVVVGVLAWVTDCAVGVTDKVNELDVLDDRGLVTVP